MHELSCPRLTSSPMRMDATDATDTTHDHQVGAMSPNRPQRFARYVAIGDSSTEGLRDSNGQGSYRGWSRRLAQRIANEQGKLLYANLGVRGLTTRQILGQQLPPALAMQPDLVTMFSGTNDVLRKEWNVREVAHDMETMQLRCIEQGATVLTFTLPDLTPIMPMARWIAPRIHEMNEALGEATARTGAILLDFAAYPVATDMRLWDPDRIHANSVGHTRIANALAFALQLPGSDDSWKAPLAAQAPASVLRKLQMEASWIARYLLPWLGKRLLPRERPPRQDRLLPILEPVMAKPGVTN